MTQPPPAPAPAPPVRPGVKQAERPHPLTPFIRGWLVLVAIVLGFARQFLENGSSGGGINTSDLRWIVPFGVAVVLAAAAAGFLSWYFTRFVIDDDELRIETGVVVKRSRRVPFERLQSVDIVQPFAARFFGLAELRLEAGAGGSGIKLRYLSRVDASRLRDYLLTRAHGHSARIADVADSALPSRFTDLGQGDRTLVRVSPQRLIGSFLLTNNWLVTAGFALLIFVITAAFQVAVALPGLIPVVISAVSMIGSRVIAMFNFTVAESGRGVRITRGLTNLASQSVPVNRVQGVRITQPLLWRPFGWYRVDVDILGYTSSDEGRDRDDATTVLLPVGAAADVSHLLDRVLPGIDLDTLELRRAPRRAAVLSWFDFWTLRSGYDARVVVTEQGWLTHARYVVPHAKAQSVRMYQGPLQRRLGLADVHIDTPRGPVKAVARLLEARAARELAMSQLGRARAARSTAEGRAALSPDDASEADLLDHFGIGADTLIGTGGEAKVYALDAERVLRVYHSNHQSTVEVVGQLQGLYRAWADQQMAVPLILQNGTWAGRVYTVNRRLPGENFADWLAGADPTERPAALMSYLDAAGAVQQLPAPIPGFARLVGSGAPARFDSLVSLLTAQLQPQLEVSRVALQADIPQVARVWEELVRALHARQCRPAVVHGDFCPANIYLARSDDGRLRISGVGDFSPHTLVADPWMDLAGAVIFLELEPYPEAVADSRWLEQQALSRWGRDLARWIAVYRRFYGFYFSSAYRFDPALYQWCIRQLTPLGG